MTPRRPRRSPVPHRLLQAAGLLLSLLFAAAFAPPARADSYAETILFSFPQNADGSTPDGQTPFGLIQGSDGNFYGTTLQTMSGGGGGTIYRITPAGDFTLLHSFSGGDDGSNPSGRLVEGPDHRLYGTTHSGGSTGNGTVYAITPAGALTTLHTFAGPEGITPGAFSTVLSTLLLGADGNLYGSTQASGNCACGGAVYRITTGGAFTVIGKLATGGGQNGEITALIRDADGSLYGTTAARSLGDNATIFKMTTAGVVSELHTFTAADNAGDPAELLRGIDGNLYGTTLYSTGSNGQGGAIFKLAPDGSFGLVYNSSNDPNRVISLRALRQLADGSFQGLMTIQHGQNNDVYKGVFFSLLAGGQPTATFSFPDGDVRSGGSESDILLASDGNYYGVATSGGTDANNYSGTVFKLAAGGPPAPTVTISASPATIALGSSSTLTWSSTDATSCTASGAWAGTKATSGSQSVTPAATGSGTYTLTCTGAGGSGTGAATVTVGPAPPPPPTVTISATPATIAPGGSSSLSWSSTNANSCTASGAWSGSQPTSGSATVAPAAAGTYTYTLSCVNGSGSGSGSAATTLTVTAAASPPPMSPSQTDIAGHAGGGVGLESLAGLGLFALWRRRRLAFAVAACAVATTAVAQETPAPVLQFDLAHAYVGLRGGAGIYTLNSNRLANSLSADGYAVSGIHVDHNQAAGAIYGGVPVCGPLALELGLVDLGRYGVDLATTSSDSQGLARDALRRLPAAGRGVTLGFGSRADLVPWFAVASRLGLLVYRSKQDLGTPAGNFSDRQTGVGVDAGLSLLFHPLPAFYLGAGYDCYHTDRGCDAQMVSGQIEFRYGR